VSAGVRAVGLLKGFENQGLLLLIDADARIADGEGDHLVCALKRLIFEVLRFAAGPRDTQVHLALFGKFKSIGEEILEHLLETFLVGLDRLRHIVLDGHRKVEVVLRRHLAEEMVQVFRHLTD